MFQRLLAQLFGRKASSYTKGRKRSLHAKGMRNQLRIEHLENRSLMAANVLPTLVTGTGTILNHQDSFYVNLQESTVNGLPSYAGSLTFSDSTASKTFTAASITSVHVEQGAANPITDGVMTTNGYVSITGTAKLNDGTDTSYKFTANASLPFPAVTGSTGGIGFQVSGPNGFSYSTPWKPWDAGETIAVTLVPAPLGATTTSLAASSSTTVYGQPVKFTATVAAVGSTVVPGGTVDFKIDDRAPVLGTLVNGVAYVYTSDLGVGSHKIVASYEGTSLFATSSATIAAQTVTKAGSITYISYTGTIGLGQPLTLKSYVGAQAPGGGLRTGTVTFYDGTSILGTKSLVGTAPVELALPTGLSIGSHSITAAYSGDGNFTPSVSTALKATIAATPTYTQLASSVNPVLVGQTVTLTATVHKPTTDTRAIKPTGSVDFYDGDTKLGSAAINGDGIANFPTAFTGASSHLLHAKYNGDASFAGSTANLTEVVTKAKTKSVVSISSSTGVSVSGAPVTFLIYVNGGANTTGATGSVTLYDGSSTKPIGTVQLTAPNGKATFTTSDLVLGKHTIYAAYAGDANFTNGAASMTESIIAAVASTVSGSGSTVSGQNSLNLNVNTAILNSLPQYTGTLTFRDSKAAITLTASTINEVVIVQAGTPVQSGVITTNTYFFITGTGTVNGGAKVYNFKLSVSFPFPANAGSTGGLEMQISGADFNYSAPWSPWDKGNSVSITLP